ncbi:long-subunit acyl-CoA synthetase (AMP-forming) [Marinimicrobium koreense]|uniref:Long-subunit acyl-CoA synthetase (AMP-forming) n=1 Tax=Marinimicrobium koreense TaxID=306545 RepID=A0A3N1NZI0_9GAMM|nr:AMP-binding protein [Marinimicrobium koreense]ROQ21533.1 long-subunit acyl-CoA synthetase (AMP-forming) [Marinimicrobium koreense]
MNELLERLARWSLLHPSRVALRDDEQTVTYRQLWNRVQGVAQAIMDSGVQRLGLVGDNSVAWVVADLACVRAGVVSVPVPTFFSPSQRQHLVETAGLDGILLSTADVRADEVAETVGGGLWMHRLPVERELSVLPPGTVKITFTSGSTGTPKGVCLSAAQLGRTLRALDTRLSQLELPQHLSVLPLATLLENVAGVYLSLFRGAEVSVPGLASLGLSGSSGMDSQRWLSEQNRWQPTSLILVPELTRVLIEGAESGALQHRGYRFLAVGGGRVSPSLLRRAEKLELPMFQGYGLSECGSVVALNAPADNRIGSAGRVLDHVDVHVGPGGELQISGSSFLGYLGETPVDESHAVASGDLGFLDQDGFLWVSGRKKNLLITGFGRNISPEWLEAELTQSAGMAQALVFGDGEPHPLALLYPGSTDNGVEDCRQAIEALNANLPDYARLSHVYLLPCPFQNIDSTAVTPNGRIRRALVLESLESWLASAECLSTQSIEQPQPRMFAQE